MMIIRFIMIFISFSTPLYAAGYPTTWGGIADGFERGLQSIRQLQEIQLLQEQEYMQEQQRLKMEQEQQRMQEQQRLMREEEQRRAEQQRLNTVQEQRRSEQQRFNDRVRIAHPDFEKYRDNGAIKAWIQKQPEYLRDSLLKVYNSGDVDSSIALIAHFKKENNIPMVGALSYASVSKTGSDGRFIAYDNSTILDTKTNLIWAEKDNGSNINWQGAKSYCENYRGGGYTDWRMPTQDELAGLYNAGKSQRAECNSSYQNHVATDLIHLTCFYPWASETRDSAATNFSFVNGIRSWDSQSYTVFTRALPVRSAK